MTKLSYSWKCDDDDDDDDDGDDDDDDEDDDNLPYKHYYDYY